MLSRKAPQHVNRLEPVHRVAILRAAKSVQIREALALNHLGCQQDLAVEQPDDDLVVGFAGRVLQTHLHAGDFDVEGIRGRFDVAWLSHILHGEGPDGCAGILKKAVATLEPGGMILVQEFILSDTMDGPPFPALFSLNMLLGTPQGQAYSEGQLVAMLAAAGVSELRRLPLELPNGAGVIAGIVAGKK